MSLKATSFRMSSRDPSFPQRFQSTWYGYPWYFPHLIVLDCWLLFPTKLWAPPWLYDICMALVYQCMPVGMDETMEAGRGSGSFPRRKRSNFCFESLNSTPIPPWTPVHCQPWEAYPGRTWAAAAQLYCPGQRQCLYLILCNNLQGKRIWKGIYIYMSEWKSLSYVQLFATPWTIAHPFPFSMGFSRQEYWSGWLFLSPGDLPDPGITPGSPELQANSLPSESLYIHM